jgi:thimet oligopeptidase
MVRITTDDPDYYPIMKFATSDGLRLRLYQAYLNRGYPKNLAVLTQLLSLRAEIAHLLGYASWADYNAAPSMTKDAKTIARFICEMDRAARPVAEKEFPWLLAQKRKIDHDAITIGEHEFSFLSERARLAAFDVDSSIVRTYLPFAAVRQGLWDVASKFFHVEFREERGDGAWHSSVETWDVFENGSMIGRIYLDLHPRPGKHGGVETIPLRSGKTGRQLPEVLVIANTPLPNGNDPGLMDPGDVSDLFHEFGHAMHFILYGSQSRWAGTGWWNIEFDFLEVPSQLFEKISMLPSVLPMFAHHYKTNKPIPTDLVNRFQRANAFGRGMAAMRGNAFSAISFELYNRKAGQVDPDTVSAEETERHSLLKLVPETHTWASFDQLAGYSSTYYMYDWDAVIVEDFLSQFSREKPLDREVALRYRSTVLIPGGSASANDLVRNFLGRPQGFDAYQRWLQEGGPLGKPTQ